jgi:hypothetical protein
MAANCFETVATDIHWAKLLLKTTKRGTVAIMESMIEVVVPTN